MTEQQPLKKQIKYVSFSSRILASLLDSILVTFLILPLFAIITPLFYGGTNPGEQLMPILQNAMQNTYTFSEFIKGLQVFLNDPRTHTIAMENHLLIKKAFEAILQVLVLFCATYFFWVYRAATPGKMLISARIADAKTFEKPTRKQYVIRFLGYFISLLPFFLGFFWIALNKKKQGWHDLLAGTVVIKK